MPVTALTDSSYMVRNLKPGPSVFRDAPSDTSIRWEGSGDPQGGDYVYVDTETIRKAQFQANIRKGVLQVLTQEEAEMVTTGQPLPSDPLVQQASDAIYRPQVNDIVATACIGPGGRAGASCSNQVTVRRSEMADKPLLCEAHKPLESQYVPGEDVDPATGLAVRTWQLATMTAPITQPTPIA